MTALRIGVDFDNTLAGYDEVFADAARETGLVAPEFRGDKRDVRAFCRSRPDGEADWMRLQGRVYGALMHKARLIDGVCGFFTRCRKAGVALFIVSHKTRYGHFDDSKIDLRDAAWAWMEGKGFFDSDDIGLSRENVFFESDRVTKVDRIAALSCSHFVDDLAEVFREPSFPPATRGILFTNGRAAEPGPYLALSDWNAIGDAIFGH